MLGEWEGDSGLDASYHDLTGRVGGTKYRERNGGAI
jgi:hypothetical protein